MENREIVVTGACGAIGTEIVKSLTTKGFRVIGVCRKCPPTADGIADGTKCIEADLSNIRSVKNLAAQLIESHKVGVLVNNAATATRMRMETSDGIELMFATNVLSYYWLTASLLPLLRRTSQETGVASRVINVASTFAGNLDLDDVEMQKRPFNATVAYKQTKAMTRMLACGFSSINDVWLASCNPGVTPGKLTSILTSSLPRGGIIDMWTSMASVPAAVAADIPVYLASDEQVTTQPSGQFYVGHRGQFDSEFCSDSSQLDQFWYLLSQYCNQ